jgi:hypothetical protein
VEFIATANAVPLQQWQQSPGAGRWSAAEVVVHVTLVEQAITEGARKVIRGDPRRFSFLSRLHPPLQIVAWRGIKRKTPIPLDPTLVTNREAMLARLAEGRAQTLAFLEENHGHDLSRWFWRHPALGPLNYYAWFRVMGYHDLRHAKQIREIVGFFRK